MSLSCTCSHCGARMRAPAKAAGCQAKCPKCRASITVPPLPANACEEDVPQSAGIRSTLQPPPIDLGMEGPRLPVFRRRKVALFCAVAGVVAFFVIVLAVLSFRQTYPSSSPAPARAWVGTPVAPVNVAKRRSWVYESLTIGRTRAQIWAAIKFRTEVGDLRVSDAWGNDAPAKPGEVKWPHLILLEVYQERGNPSNDYVCALYRYHPSRPPMALRAILDEEWVLEDKTDNDFFPATNNRATIRRCPERSFNLRWKINDKY